MIYLVRAGPTGAVKIGWTHNIRQRLGNIQSSLPDDLIVLQVVEGGWEGEAILHERFAHLRLRGEWFTYAPEMEQDLGTEVSVVTPPVDPSEVILPPVALVPVTGEDGKQTLMALSGPEVKRFFEELERKFYERHPDLPRYDPKTYLVIPRPDLMP